jgi:hypothetical protein
MMKKGPATKWKKFSLLFQRGADAIFDDGVYYHVSTFCSRLKKKTHISATHFTQFTNTKCRRKKKKQKQNVHKSLDGSSPARQTPTQNNQAVRGSAALSKFKI